MNTEQDEKTVRNPKTPILFVDDDPMAHKIVKNHLKEWNVIFVYSGEDALDILSKGQVAIVVSDINMPGISGIELLRRIRKKHSMVQVIIVTASEDTEHLLHAFEAGASDFLLKPLKRADIEDALLNASSRVDRWKKVMKDLFKRRVTRKADG
jgi:DNA-binding response OmpR family regulator